MRVINIYYNNMYINNKQRNSSLYYYNISNKSTIHALSIISLIVKIALIKQITENKLIKIIVVIFFQ